MLGESNRGQQNQSIDAIGRDQRARLQITDEAVLGDRRIPVHALVAI